MGGNFAPRQQQPEPIGAGYRARRISSLFGSDPRIAALMRQFAGQFGGPNVGSQIFSGPGGLPIFDVGSPDLQPGAIDDYSTVPTMGPGVAIDPVLMQVLLALQQEVLGAGATELSDAAKSEVGTGASLGQEVQTPPLEEQPVTV